MRAEEKNEQRHHQSPRKHAARELDGRESEPDDVADAQIGGAHTGGGKGAHAAGTDDILASGKTKPDLTTSQISYGKLKILARGEQSEASEDVHNSANPDVPEKIFRSLRASLPGLMNLGGRHRLGEGQLRVFHHHASH